MDFKVDFGKDRAVLQANTLKAPSLSNTVPKFKIHRIDTQYRHIARFKGGHAAKMA